MRPTIGGYTTHLGMCGNGVLIGMKVKVIGMECPLLIPSGLFLVKMNVDACEVGDGGMDPIAVR